jgi:teichuronic acid biosynthesis glycosyltransferase TuaG
MTCYNSSLFIEEAIQSVLNQIYKSWELIIVDDASTDDSRQLIEKYIDLDSRIKLFINKENLGAAKSRNYALQEAQGRFIAFLDSDDIWFVTKLEEQISFMLKKEIPISFTSYQLIDNQSDKINHIIHSVPVLNYQAYLKNTIIGFSTSMIDKDIIRDIRFVNIRTRQDTYLWISLLKKGFKAYGLKKVLVNYRVHDNSISSNKRKAAIQVWRIYRNFEKMSFLKAGYYFLFYIFNALKKRTIRK